VTVVVADTSVYVSALVFGGVPQAALVKALTAPCRVAVSPELKAELAMARNGTEGALMNEGPRPRGAKRVAMMWWRRQRETSDLAHPAQVPI
jgi:hypothetical protein